MNAVVFPYWKACEEKAQECGSASAREEIFAQYERVKSELAKVCGAMAEAEAMFVQCGEKEKKPEILAEIFRLQELRDQYEDQANELMVVSVLLKG